MKECLTCPTVSIITPRFNKIALLTDGIWPFVIGGMQKHSYLLTKYLIQKNFSVVLFHPILSQANKEELKTLFTNHELDLLEIVEVSSSIKYKFPGHYLFESYIYSKRINDLLINREDVDFIYAKGLTSWYLLGNRKCRVPVGINIHGYEFMQLQANINERLNSLMLSFPFKYINKKADYIFSYGGNITSYIKKIGIKQGQIVEIPGAVEQDWILPEKKKIGGVRKFLFLGRFERRKGIEEISSVLEQIVNKNVFEFHFVGSIPDSLKIKHDRIFYHDVLRTKGEILKVLDKAHVLVCPSYSEGMPNVIMEAMARKCAIIATNVGAVNLLVDRENGWLIEAANVNSLENAITDAINAYDTEIEHMAEISCKRIEEKFNWERVSEITFEKLNELI